MVQLARHCDEGSALQLFPNASSHDSCHVPVHCCSSAQAGPRICFDMTHLLVAHRGQQHFPASVLHEAEPDRSMF